MRQAVREGIFRRVGLCALLGGIASSALTVGAVAADSCDQAFNHREVIRALAAIEASIDPCGHSTEVNDLLAKFRVCARQAYPVCIDRMAARNSTDRARLEGESRVFITWNPALRSELQTGCGGDPTRIVRRDPTASLLHEIAHVVQDCAGLDPNAHELEAVRIENIYRRAQRLCQRTAYGDQPLPDAMVVECHPGRCTCTPRDLQIAGPSGTMAPASAGAAAGDAAHPPGALDR